jgi:hypothetical protein
MTTIKTIFKLLLALLMLFAGVMHFVSPGFFLKIMPPYLPLHLELVYLSGVFEVGLGICLPPSTNPETELFRRSRICKCSKNKGLRRSRPVRWECSESAALRKARLANNDPGKLIILLSRSNAGSRKRQWTDCLILFIAVAQVCGRSSMGHCIAWFTV